MRILNQTIVSGRAVKALAGAFLLIGSTVARADYDTADTSYDAGFLTNYSYDSADYTVDGQSHGLTNVYTYDMVGSDPLPTSPGSVDVMTTYDFQGMLDGNLIQGTGDITTRVTYDSIGNYTDTVESMNMTGFGDGHTVRFQYDAAGQVSTSETVTPEGGGMFRVHSFFDVFTEISLDGGAFTGPTGGSYNGGHLRFTPSPTPEPFTLGLVATGLAIATLKRRRASL